MRNGETVAAFERQFAEYVGARYCIALCNGTATLHTALVALGVKPGDRVAVPPLTMSSTTIAVLHAGAVPVFVDVDPETWLAENYVLRKEYGLAVSLYGLHWPENWAVDVDDAAQTLRPHGSGAAFTSYSFQASKILSCGEGGALVTNDEALATKAREFSSLGYQMRPDQPRIDPAVLKSPTYQRHHSLGWNYRMSDAQAALLLSQDWDTLKASRLKAAECYRQAIDGVDWLIPQHVPEGFKHDYWAYSVAIGEWGDGTGAVVDIAWGSPEDQRQGEARMRWNTVARLIERYGGERPYAAWRLTYQEPAFEHLVRSSAPFQVPFGLEQIGLCPIAESLQPRLLQFQTNNLESAERNAIALRKAIQEIG
jgi:perosamine synthetase